MDWLGQLQTGQLRRADNSAAWGAVAVGAACGGSDRMVESCSSGHGGQRNRRVEAIWVVVR